MRTGDAHFEMGEYSADHWLRVRQMIERALETSGFECQLVSDAKDVSFIYAQKVRESQPNLKIIAETHLVMCRDS